MYYILFCKNLICTIIVNFKFTNIVDKYGTSRELITWKNAHQGRI
jgi:hypothetical protein